MAIRFYKLEDLLRRKGLKKKDLVQPDLISSATMAKLSRGDNVTTETIDRICAFLHVQPSEIMEYVEETPEEKEERLKRIKERSAKDNARRKAKEDEIF